jgi:hypothetical protein
LTPLSESCIVCEDPVRALREEALQEIQGGFSEPQPTLFHKGTNQTGMREHNERVVLSLVRHHGSLSKSDIARMTSLSAQTASVIMRQLEMTACCRARRAATRQDRPAVVPMSLNPDGAYSWVSRSVAAAPNWC